MMNSTNFWMTSKTYFVVKPECAITIILTHKSEYKQNVLSVLLFTHTQSHRRRKTLSHIHNVHKLLILIHRLKYTIYLSRPNNFTHFAASLFSLASFQLHTVPVSREHQSTDTQIPGIIDRYCNVEF